MCRRPRPPSTAATAAAPAYDHNGNSSPPGSAARPVHRVTTVPRSPDPDAPAQLADDIKLFSVEPIQRWLGFAKGSVVRHKLFAVIALLGGLLAGSLLLLSSWPVYESRAAILVQTGSPLWNAVDPEAVTPLEPVRNSIAAALTRQSVLDSLIDETGLMEKDPELGFFAELRESLTSLGGQQSEQAKRAELRTRLEESIFVTVPEDNTTVDITVMWPDAEQALAIALASERNFFENRLDIEVSPLNDAIVILEQQAAEAAQRVEDERTRIGLGPLDEVPGGSVLEDAIDEQRDALSALRRAELQQMVAEASFKTRYVEMTPAELAPAPLGREKIPMAMTLIFGVIVAVGVCVGLDLYRKRVVETWQLGQQGVPVLATLKLRRTAPSPANPASPAIGEPGEPGDRRSAEPRPAGGRRTDAGRPDAPRHDEPRRGGVCAARQRIRGRRRRLRRRATGWCSPGRGGASRSSSQRTTRRRGSPTPWTACERSTTRRTTAACWWWPTTVWTAPQPSLGPTAPRC